MPEALLICSASNIFIELGKAAVRGFPVVAVNVTACVIHGFDDEVKRNFSCKGQEVCKSHSINCTHGSNGVALDAGNLNQAENRVAGQSQMVFNGDFRRIFAIYLGNVR